MRTPYLCLGASLMALIVVYGSCPARAQRHATAPRVSGPKAETMPRVNPGSMPHVNPQFNQQMQQYHQAMMQQQAQMAAMMHQAHQQNLQGFQEWLKSNPGTSGQPQTGGSSHLPESPAAFASWYNTQKHNKARNKSYDPAYDQYREFEKSQKTSRHHQQKSATTPSTQQEGNPQVASQSHPQSNSQLQQNPQPSNQPIPQLTGQRPQPGVLQNSQQQPNLPQQSILANSTISPPSGTPPATNPSGTGPGTTSPTTAASQQARGVRHPIGYPFAAMLAANRLPWAADQGLISHLRTAHAKLQQADHDYQGHRARAVGHIVSALRHLGAGSLPLASIAPGTGQLPQAQSDSLLRDALSRLNTVEGQLTSRTTFVAHHVNARNSVAAAMGELNTALSIR
jgi:hypothetical protein